MVENINGVVGELGSKGYPTSWWEGELQNSQAARGTGECQIHARKTQGLKNEDRT